MNWLPMCATEECVVLGALAEERCGEGVPTLCVLSCVDATKPPAPGSAAWKR